MHASIFFSSSLYKSAYYDKSKADSRSAITLLKELTSCTAFKDALILLNNSQLRELKHQLLSTRTVKSLEYEMYYLYRDDLLSRYSTKIAKVLDKVSSNYRSVETLSESLSAVEIFCMSMSNYILELRSKEKRERAQSELTSLSNGLLQAAERLNDLSWSLKVRSKKQDPIRSEFLEAASVLTYGLSSDYPDRFETSLNDKISIMERLFANHNDVEVRRLTDAIIPLIQHILNTSCNRFYEKPTVGEECQSLIRAQW